MFPGGGRKIKDVDGDELFVKADHPFDCPERDCMSIDVRHLAGGGYELDWTTPEGSFTHVELGG